MRALALNAGSSSLKAALYDIETLPPLAEPPDPVQRAEVDAEPGEPAGGTVRRVLERVGGTVDVVGHRVVHGGEHFREPTHVTDEVRSQIDALSASAPLHNAAALDGVAAAEAALGPGVPQVAVFDTAFHASLAPAAYAYAGPYEWLDAGLRRFGFHGINHEYVAHRAARLLDRELADLRLITCHLGSGCSLAAVRGGVSVDTTMGFTPLEGLPMATRSGSVDPGLVLHLLRSPGCSAEALSELLNQRSGLAGMAGGTGDLREVLADRERGEPRAQLAFDVYVHRLRRALGEMLASLGGVDAVVFTGGIGEAAPAVRAAALEPFEFLGLVLDPDHNAASPDDANIAHDRSRVSVLVIAAREDWAIARSAAKGCLGRRSRSGH